VQGKVKKVVEAYTTDYVVFDEVFQQMSVPCKGTKRNNSFVLNRGTPHTRTKYSECYSGCVAIC
jgi:hypothetical protein